MSDTPDMFLPPWNGANIGTQTMYCSDCHGRNTANGTAEPPAGTPWGPHGSENDFILKGTWGTTTGNDNSGICFRCHSRSNYATDVNDGKGDFGEFDSGFGGPRNVNLHHEHAKRIDRPNLRCTWCHVAVPHGWKNKALLVNLNDVGPEAGETTGTEILIDSDAASYTKGPYYLNAKLKILNFAESGTWQDSDCGSLSGTGTEARVGKDWMGEVCLTPP